MNYRLSGLSLLILIVSSLFGGFASAQQPPTEASSTHDGSPMVVESVDIQKYMGKWYEIAHIPMFFQRKCEANTTAEYSLLADGRVSVLNSCQTASGDRITAEGNARVTDPTTNAKLKVAFFKLPWLGWQFWAGGDYWIIDLAPDYSTAIVGHPTHKYGWILSRTPSLDIDTLKVLTKRLSEQGYNPCKFETTPQPGGISVKQPLCVMVSGQQ